MVKTLDVSQQVALVQLVPQDSCGFVDDGNMKQKRPYVCDASHSKNTPVKDVFFNKYNRNR